MTVGRLLVIGEGPQELGSRPADASARDWPLAPERLPALPRLVSRLLDAPDGVAFSAALIREQMHVHRGIRTGLKRKLLGALRTAREKRYRGAVYVMDRDRQSDRDTIAQLRSARDAFTDEFGFACAVGAAVETFDAWMIADPNAVEAAGGDKTKCHPTPETLDKSEDRGEHPKCHAAAAFGGSGGLAARYAAVAAAARIDHLERACPQGFAPFAREVRERIGPVVSADS